MRTLIAIVVLCVLGGAALIVLSEVVDRDSRDQPGLLESASADDNGNAQTQPPDVSGDTSDPASGAPPIPEGVLVDISTYGAVGDGKTDDTAAIQAALDEGNRSEVQPGDNALFDQPLGLYFPPGDYLVSSTLRWLGCCVTLQGAGPDESSIVLIDGAPGFDDASSPSPVLLTPDGNDSFRQTIRGLTIDVGANNPGAVALDYIGNNTAAIDDVHLIASPSSGAIGLDLGRQWPGPLLVQHLRVEGFAVGVRTLHNEYGPTFEDIQLIGQTAAGFSNRSNTLAIRGLVSTNRVPAIDSTGSVVLIDADLSGGDSSTPAIINTGELYLRDVHTDGYGLGIDDHGQDIATLDFAEYVSGPVMQLFDETAGSLDLPIEDTPVALDEPTSAWAVYRPGERFDQAEFQAILDSGARTVAIPFGRYQLDEQIVVEVPSSVERIVGFSAAIDRAQLRLVIADGEAPLVIEEFNDGIVVDHASERTVVFAHGRLSYEPGPTPGTLFLEDVLLSELRVSPGQRVWARQMNVEGYVEGEPRVVNDGGTLWVLGLKTEKPGTVIRTIDGGSTEVLGTLIYPAMRFSDIDRANPAFDVVDADFSIVYSVSSYTDNTNYQIQIREERNGDVRELSTNDVDGRHVPLFVGRGTP